MSGVRENGSGVEVKVPRGWLVDVEGSSAEDGCEENEQ